MLFLYRYDFSEPQFGKDLCDRIISPLKGAIKRFCNEGNDILCASDMYKALQARPVKEPPQLYVRLRRIPKSSKPFESKTLVHSTTLCMIKKDFLCQRHTT